MVTKKEMTKIKSYVEDTPHMLRIFQEENEKGPLPEGSFPVSIDVKALYSNIPHDGEDGGMKAFEEMLEKREDKSIPTAFLMTLLAFVMKGNFFQFVGKLFRQVIGASMGTRVAPNYACTFMSRLEENKLLGQWKGTPPRLYKRYIDDLFMIWTSTEEELLQFLKHMNGCHETIKFTISYDLKSRSVAFLDMLVSIDDKGFIKTDLFKKPTSVCQYLLPSSCHAGHVTRNIPYSLAYRLLRICSERETFLTRLEELRSDLISRSYNPKVIHDAFQRVLQVPREVALQKVQRAENTREVFSTKFHPSLPSLSKIIHKHHAYMVESDKEMGRCFMEPSLVSYKRSKNIKEHLIRAKVSTTRHSKRHVKGFKPCGSLCTMCVLSPNFISKHKCHKSGEEWAISSAIDCNTRNCVYKLTCKKSKCKNWFYIGETERRCKDRLYDHKSYVHRKRLETAAGHHFNLPGHDVTDLTMTPIERVRPSNNDHIRRIRESLWITRYDAISNGENKKR